MSARPCAARSPSARTPPSGPVFLSLPMDILDQEVTARRRRRPRRRGSALRPTRRGSPRRSPASIRIGSIVLLGDDLAARRAPGSSPSPKRAGFRCGARSSRPGPRFPPTSVLGGRAQARFRRDARPLQGRSSHRAGGRPGVRRLPLSRRRTGARGRRGAAYRRQPGGVRARARRRHGAARRHRPDARGGGRDVSTGSPTRKRSRRGSSGARR